MFGFLACKWPRKPFYAAFERQFELKSIADVGSNTSQKVKILASRSRFAVSNGGIRERSAPTILKWALQRFHILSILTMFVLKEKLQPRCRKLGPTCQQCGKRTKTGAKKLSHEIVFELLSKNIFPKLAFGKICSCCHEKFDVGQFSTRVNELWGLLCSVCVIFPWVSFSPIHSGFGPEHCNYATLDAGTR